MNSDTRLSLLRKKEELKNDINALNRVRTEELTYQQSIKVNQELKEKRQKYKLICIVLEGLKNGKRNDKSNKDIR